MKLILPYYYNDFRCVAGRCEDNCCIGWGIYIDDLTAEKYRKIGGKFGERLSASIDSDEQCFINDKDGRCPFLNGDNLCDIIINVGEENLCEICNRHPRFFEWFDDSAEGGLGLSCEVAARLILGADGFSTFETETDDIISDDEPCDGLFYSFLKSAREKIISKLLDERIPLEESLENIAFYAEELQNLTDCYMIDEVPEISDGRRKFDVAAALNIMVEAEKLDESQQEYFENLSRLNGDKVAFEDEKELRNIAVYFIWRYFMKGVFSGNIYPKILLAVFSVNIINLMFNYGRKLNGEFNFGDRCAAAKEFSKIIEYSEDNLRLIYDSYEY